MKSNVGQSKTMKAWFNVMRESYYTRPNFHRRQCLYKCYDNIITFNYRKAEVNVGRPTI